MALAPGTRVGSYEVIVQIGAGGMGEVYRARDTKLNRDVALKILPAAFTLDGDSSIDDVQFQKLLEQVRELHQLADELTHSPRIHTNVRARLYAYPNPPSLPQQQRELADEIVELIKDRRLSARQAGLLERAFFVGP